mmetsp:Transcript_7471/g.11324  ORF Transcript_7471/g.11324 Transcript_7471/m.11324 type:complete len:241 (+) Transcript_7471:133-855(+)
MKVYNSMSSSSCDPDRFTITTLIKGAGSEKWELALSLFKSFQSKANLEKSSMQAEEPEKFRRNFLDRKIYYAAIGACEGAGESIIADTIFKELISSEGLRLRIVQNHDALEVDFHTMSAAVARCTLRKVLTDLLEMGDDVKKAGDLELVVGKGETRGESVIGPVIESALLEESPLLQSRVSDINKGRLIVSSKDIVAWIQKKTGSKIRLKKGGRGIKGGVRAFLKAKKKGGNTGNKKRKF